MAERMTREESRALAEALKREAEAMRPEFSESLHARICSALKQDGVRAAPLPGASWRGHPRLWAAAAAVCLLGVSLAVWQLIGPSAPLPVPAVPAIEEAKLPEVTDPLRELSEATVEPRRTAQLVGLTLDSSLTLNQWASLDHDARLATRMLIDQLPFDVTGMREN